MRLILGTQAATITCCYLCWMIMIPRRPGPLQALRQQHQQLELQWGKFGDSVPAWHLAVQHLQEAAKLDQTDLASFSSEPASTGAGSLSEPLEKAVSSLLTWAQTAREQLSPSQGRPMKSLKDSDKPVKTIHCPGCGRRELVLRCEQQEKKSPWEMLSCWESCDCMQCRMDFRQIAWRQFISSFCELDLTSRAQGQSTLSGLQFR